MRFYIYDWAGNCLEMHGYFETFEDAWDYVLGDMTDKLGLNEEDYQEYFVENKEPREKRYLQANDIRMKRQ